MGDQGTSFSGTILRSDSMRSDSLGASTQQQAPRQMVKPSGSMNALRSPIPIDKAACISLVTNALKAAREHAAAEREARGRGNNSPDPGGIQYPRPGVTINLSHSKIANIPLEVLELIKDEIERLALAHNQLTSFSDEFSSLPRLRYLNLRSNFLKEFPLALTRLPSLEILDVSRNRLRLLPQDFGKLMSLKVLSMSKNKINLLPTYIGDMNELKILKLDHNPLLFPPKEILENEEADRDAWLESVKRFLKQHADKSSGLLGAESGSSSDEGGGGGGGGDNDYSSINATLVGKPSVESFQERSDSITATIKPAIKSYKRLGESSPFPGRMSPDGGEAVQKRSGSLPRRPKHLLKQMPATMPNSPLKSPGMSSTPLSATERSRSNSESLVPTNRVSRRMGMVGTRGEMSNAAAERLRTVDEQKQVKHQRGYSHDSAAFDSAQRSGRNGSSRSPTERQPGQYFRRLSSLPENKRSSLSSARIGKAARGILYALSTLQCPIEDFVQSFGDQNGPHNKVEIALYNGNICIGSLVGALETYEEKDDGSAVDQVIDACYSCVSAFKQVLAMLRSTSRDIGAGIIGSDARYIRTLLLMVYGSYVEIQSSYETLRPLLVGRQISEGVTQSFNNPYTAGRHPTPSNQRLKSGSTASTTSSVAASVVLASQMANAPPPLPTPRHQDTFVIPPTPGLSQPILLSAQSDGGFDRDEPLYGKFQAATNTAIVTLPIIEREIKAAGAHNLQPSTTLKLREVSSLCMAGTEAARRLSKIKWEAIQDGDMNERRRFWEDTNKFTNLVINVAELIKSVMQEYTFQKHILVAVGTVVRPTKDLYILMNGSAFRHMAEHAQPHTQIPPGAHYSAFQSMSSGPATPLSAALGIATQATVPQGYFPMGMGPGVGQGSRSGTLLSQTHPTMTSTVSEVGMAFGKAQAPLKLS